MAQLSALRTIRAAKMAALTTVRAAHQAAIDAYVAQSSCHSKGAFLNVLSAWDRIGETEIACRDALESLNALDAEIEHIELVNVGVRRAPVAREAVA